MASLPDPAPASSVAVLRPSGGTVLAAGERSVPQVAQRTDVNVPVPQVAHYGEEFNIRRTRMVPRGDPGAASNGSSESMLEYTRRAKAIKDGRRRSSCTDADSSAANLQPYARPIPKLKYLPKISNGFVHELSGSVVSVESPTPRLGKPKRKIHNVTGSQSLDPHDFHVTSKRGSHGELTSQSSESMFRDDGMGMKAANASDLKDILGITGRDRDRPQVKDGWLCKCQAQHDKRNRKSIITDTLNGRHNLVKPTKPNLKSPGTVNNGLFQENGHISDYALQQQGKPQMMLSVTPEGSSDTTKAMLRAAIEKLHKLGQMQRQELHGRLSRGRRGKKVARRFRFVAGALEAIPEDSRDSDDREFSSDSNFSDVLPAEEQDYSFGSMPRTVIKQVTDNGQPRSDRGGMLMFVDGRTEINKDNNLGGHKPHVVRTGTSVKWDSSMKAGAGLDQTPHDMKLRPAGKHKNTTPRISFMKE